MLAKVVQVYKEKFEDVDSCYYHHNMNNAPYCTHLRYYKWSFYVSLYSGFTIGCIAQKINACLLQVATTSCITVYWRCYRCELRNFTEDSKSTKIWRWSKGCFSLCILCLELGSGECSTQLLHNIMQDKVERGEARSRLVTVDTDQDWLVRYTHLHSPNHAFILVPELWTFRPYKKTSAKYYQDLPYYRH